MRQQESEQKNIVSKIKPSNIFIPIVIGLGVVGYMIYKEVDVRLLQEFTFGFKAYIMLFVALLFMAGRDLGYMIRLRILSEKKLSWMQIFRVIMLWEFTSAITPSAVGGTSVAVVYVHKEGLSVGKSTTIVLLTSFFDELYFILMFPLAFWIIGSEVLFYTPDSMTMNIGMGLMAIAIIGYVLKLIFLLFVSYGLFINPRGLKWIIINVFKLPVLRRWRKGAQKAGDDIVISAAEIKNKKPKFWISAFFASVLSWSSRYLVVNAIIIAFFVFSDHFLLFARQLVMWIMMLIMPTPGGSGFAEYLFKEYLGEFIPVAAQYKIGAAALLALIWRLITYYPYLIIGAIIFPRWLKSKFGVGALKNKD